MKIGLRNNSRLTFVPISQNSNKGAWEASLSLNSSNGLNNRGEIKNNDVSFGGISSVARKQAANLLTKGRSFITKITTDEVTEIKNYRKFLDETDVFVGDGFVKKNVDNFQKLMGKKASKYMELNGNTLKVRDKSLVSKLKDGIIDVAHLPIDIAGAVVRAVGKLPFIRNTKAAEALNNISFIKKRSEQKAGMDIYYRLKGIVTYKDDVPKLRRKILGVPADKPVGNYNTRDERALNRLATGAVSSMFVGNDFYNLVMYEKNNKEEASKAGKKRRRRELFRIAVNAFMTYSVLGALSSYVNNKIAPACAAIAGSALFAEVITRVLTGIPLLPLTPEGAKKYNKKKAKKEQKKLKKGIAGSDKNALNVNNVNGAQKVNNASGVSSKPSAAINTANINNAPFDTHMRADDTMCQVFDKFRDPKVLPGNVSSPDETNKWQGTFRGDNAKPKQDDKSNPITIKRVFLAIIAVLGADLLYSFARSKSPSFNKFIIESGKEFKKLYKKIAYEDLIVQEKDLRKFLSGFKGTNMDSISQAYGRIMDVQFSEREAKALLKGAKDGVIELDQFNKIYNDAYMRTAKTNFEILNMKHKGKYASEAIRKLKSEPMALAMNPNQVSKPDAVFTEKLAHKFVKARFEIDMSKPSSIVDGVKYYRMKNSEFNFGHIKEAKRKVLIDALCYPFKAIKTLIGLPLKPVKKLAFYESPLSKEPPSSAPVKGCGKKKKAHKAKAPKKIEPQVQANNNQEQNQNTGKFTFEMPDLGELYRDCSAVFKRYQKGSITREEFSKYISKVNTNPFNKDTVPKYPQASLASISRNFVTLISSYFFVNDFRNEVLIQSNGENTEKASEISKEKIAHKFSNFILNKFFMELFNNTFNKQLLGSLAGATTVAAATEITNESSVRLSIGVPLKPMESREEIDEFEKKHLEQKGIRGAYYRLMARITGKKMLSEKAEDKK